MRGASASLLFLKITKKEWTPLTLNRFPFAGDDIGREGGVRRNTLHLKGCDTVTTGQDFLGLVIENHHSDGI